MPYGYGASQDYYDRAVQERDNSQQNNQTGQNDQNQGNNNPREQGIVKSVQASQAQAAANTVAFTLPEPSAALAGTHLFFVSLVAQIISVSTATADTMITMGDVDGDTLAAPGSIGAEIEAWCDGTSWIVLGRGETAGNTASLNYTVTD